MTSTDKVEPFLLHVLKLFPHQQDSDVLLAYLAACVQQPRCKFPWALLVQGVEGCGKTYALTCGVEPYQPSIHKMTSKFNGWVFEHDLIQVNEVDDLIKRIAPLISNSQFIRSVPGARPHWRPLKCNWILCTSSKHALNLAASDRRFAVLRTAQQSRGDLARDGLACEYFNEYAKWLEHQGGREAIREYLLMYKIPVHLSPVYGTCPDAPDTSCCVKGELCEP